MDINWDVLDYLKEDKENWENPKTTPVMRLFEKEGSSVLRKYAVVRKSDPDEAVEILAFLVASTLLLAEKNIDTSLNKLKHLNEICKEVIYDLDKKINMG